MSIWSSFNGSFKLRKGCGASVGKLLLSIYSETECKVTVEKQTESHTYYKAEWSCSIDGWDVDDYVKRVVECLKGYDKLAEVDISVETRFTT